MFGCFNYSRVFCINTKAAVVSGSAFMAKQTGVGTHVQAAQQTSNFV